jgi:hypothetical protein
MRSCSGGERCLLRDTHPHLFAQLHPTLNDEINEIAPGSARKVWWFCTVAADHVWQATVNNRTNGSTGCPGCAGRKVSVTNSLATRSPDLAAQLDPDRNGGLTADQIINGSHQKVWWRCPAGADHVWQTKVNERSVNGNGCPCCAGNRLSVTNALGILFPAVAAQFDRNLNGGLAPDQITAGSNEKRWWRCPAGPDHLWRAKVNDRSYGGQGRKLALPVRHSGADHGHVQSPFLNGIGGLMPVRHQTAEFGISAEFETVPQSSSTG